MNDKKSFVMYCDYKQHIALLSLQEKGELLDAIFDYQTDCKTKELSPIVKMAFSFMKLQFDRDRELYERKCRKNRENGTLGGRPPKPNGYENNPKKPNGYFENPTEPKKPDTDTDNDTGNDTGTDIDTDIKSTKPRTKKIKPTEEESISFFIENNSTAKEATAFFDYYEANGWVQGKSKPIKDWKAAARNWIRRSTEYSPKSMAQKQEQNNLDDLFRAALEERR